MYNDTVTIFNRYQSKLGDMWYPTVLSGVNLNVDKAAIIAKYGPESQDKASLNIKYSRPGNVVTVGKKPYLLPEDWERLPNDYLPGNITFKSGSNFDFFYGGDWGGEDPISDNDYTNGFYDYMNNHYDMVFVISSVAMYSEIPHFEIMGS